jgi:hypothetical protein
MTRRVRWLMLALALGLGPAAILLAIPDSGLAQPGSAEQSASVASNPQVGDFINILSDTLNVLDRVAVAHNSNADEYLVTWGTQVSGIYARRVDAGGTRGDVITVTTAGSFPDVAYGSVQDAYLVVYVRSLSGGVNICARRVSADGLQVGSEFTITQGTDWHAEPAVAYNSRDDEFLVVYKNVWGGGLEDIYARRVRASDGALLDWSAVATGGGGNRRSPVVAYSAEAYYGNGGYLIAYRFMDTTAFTTEIRSKVAQAHLGDLWPNPEITVCPTGVNQDAPAVAAGPDEYLVVWEEGGDIRGRRMSTDGTLQGSSAGFTVGIASNPTGLNSPALAYERIYGYLATWYYYGDVSTSHDIYGRHVKPGQDSASGSGFIIDDSTPMHYAPTVACAPSGDCLVAYLWIGGSAHGVGGRFVRPHRLYLPLVLRNR